MELALNRTSPEKRAPIPSMKSARVIVKSPDTGTPLSVEGTKARAEAFADGLGETDVLGDAVGEARAADSDAVKDGPDPLRATVTVKLRTTVCVFPVESFIVAVIFWLPDSVFGDVHVQIPFLGTVILSLMLPGWRVTVIILPAPAVPLNWGFDVEIFSPSLGLSIVNLPVGAAVGFARGCKSKLLP